MDTMTWKVSVSESVSWDWEGHPHRELGGGRPACSALRCSEWRRALPERVHTLLLLRCPALDVALDSHQNLGRVPIWCSLVPLGPAGEAGSSSHELWSRGDPTTYHSCLTIVTQTRRTAHPGAAGQAVGGPSLCRQRGLLDEDLAPREWKTEWGNETGMPPPVPCPRGRRHRRGGRALRRHRMEAQRSSRPTQLTAMSWHFLFINGRVGAAFRLPGARPGASQTRTRVMRVLRGGHGSADRLMAFPRPRSSRMAGVGWKLRPADFRAFADLAGFWGSPGGEGRVLESWVPWTRGVCGTAAGLEKAPGCCCVKWYF